MSAFDEYLAGLQAGDAARVVASLRPDTTLRVAVHAKPFVGREAISFVFAQLFSGIFSDVRVGKVLADGDHRVAVFEVTVLGYGGTAEGLNLATVNTDGELTEITVFLRPLGALQALSDEMGRRFGSPRPE